MTYKDFLEDKFMEENPEVIEDNFEDRFDNWSSGLDQVDVSRLIIKYIEKEMERLEKNTPSHFPIIVTRPEVEKILKEINNFYF